MSTREALKKGKFTNCIACGKKFTKREAQLIKEEKLERARRHTHCKGCMGKWEGYRCDDCIKEDRLAFHRRPRKRGGYNK